MYTLDTYLEAKTEEKHYSEFSDTEFEEHVPVLKNQASPPRLQYNNSEHEFFDELENTPNNYGKNRKLIYLADFI